MTLGLNPYDGPYPATAEHVVVSAAEVPMTWTVPTKPEKITERDMLDALARRYTAILGNGDRYVRAEHVRNGTGFYGYDAEQYAALGRSAGPLRTADFMAIDAWESKGHRIHGIEVKVSRSDWLTELKDPEKAETFKRYCDHWWLAVSDAAIVRDDLPAGWGLLVLQPNGTLCAKRQAPRLTPEPMPLPIMIGLARAVQKTALRATVPAVALYDGGNR